MSDENEFIEPLDANRRSARFIRERKPGIARKKFVESRIAVLSKEEIAFVKADDDFRKVWKRMPDWAQVHGVIGTYKNNDLGWDAIEIGRKGIKNTLEHGAGLEKIQSIPALPQLIQCGVYLETTHSHNAKQIGMVSHIFAAKLDLAGKRMIVGFAIREDMNGKRFYDHELMTIKNLDGFLPKLGAAPESGGRHPDARQGLVLSVLHKHLSVK